MINKISSTHGLITVVNGVFGVFHRNTDESGDTWIQIRNLLRCDGTETRGRAGILVRGSTICTDVFGFSIDCYESAGRYDRNQNLITVLMSEPSGTRQ